MRFTQQLEDLFHQHSQLDEHEQVSFCQTVASDYPELYQDFIKLVGVKDEADALFEKPIVSSNLNPLRGLTRFLATCAMEEELRKPVPMPKSIGGFEIMRPLGSGGMGIVYHARQNHPFVREVALKVIRPGLHDTLFLQHITVERQALALMNHDGIAKIYNSGATDDDRIYFTMEFVNGPHIVDYCKDNQTHLKERLVLYLQVCDAIEHAHRQGVLHGDLKPSNMLIALADKNPQCKIIDFGIARACDEVAAQLLKESGQSQLGSPAYMSPEHSTGKRDIRSDIYSLGAVLAELIHLPEQPTSTKNLRDKTEGELRWILDKLLANDPEQRYQTVKDFKQDLQNYIECRPLSIGPNSVRYKFKHWARRNRTLSLAIFSVSLALSLTAAVSFNSYIQDQRTKAKIFEMLQENQETHNFYLKVFSEAHPDFSGYDVKFVDVLKVWEDSLKTYARNNLPLEARIRITLGETYRGIGLYDQAQGQQTRAYQLFEQSYGVDHPKTQATKVRIARSLRDLSEFERAIVTLQEVLAWHEQRGGLEDSDLLLLHFTLAALFVDSQAFERVDEQLTILAGLVLKSGEASVVHQFDITEIRANACFKRDDWEQGYQLLQENLKAQVAHYGPNHHRSLLTQHNLAGILRARKKYEEAEVIYREVARGRDFILGEDHPSTLKSQHGLVICLYRLGDYESAVRLAEEVYQRQFKKLGADHRDTRSMQSTRANILASMGRYEDAFQIYEAILAMLGEGQTSAHARALNNYGHYLTKFGQPERAIPLLERAITIKEGLFKPSNMKIIKSKATLGEALMAAGLYKRATTLFEDIVRVVAMEHVDKVESLLRYRFYWGQCLLEQGQLKEAEAPLRKAYEGASANSEVRDRLRELLFKLYIAQGKKERAESFR